MSADLTTQLAEVQATITAIQEGGQEYTMPDGRMVRRPDLATLYEREKFLKGEIAAASGGRRYVPVSFGRPC